MTKQIHEVVEERMEGFPAELETHTSINLNIPTDADGASLLQDYVYDTIKEVLQAEIENTKSKERDIEKKHKAKTYCSQCEDTGWNYALEDQIIHLRDQLEKLN